MITGVLLALLLLPFILVGGILALVWKKRRRAILRWTAVAYGAAVVAVVLAVGPYLAAWALVHAGTRGPDRRLRDTPASHGVAYEDVRFDAADGLRLAGWFLPPTRRNAVLVCTHGLFRSRHEMLSRAVAAARAGYGALLYDARSHGESEPGIVSLGYYERNDVLGAMRYLERRYPAAASRPNIVLVGVSMGAVATLEAAAEAKGYAALVVDSPFASVHETVVDHSWLFLKLPRYPFPTLFLFWFERLAGFDPGRVNVRAALERGQPVPTLFLASEGDARIRAGVTRALYQASRAPVKRLEMFGKDVPHGAAARLYPERYAAVLVGFLEEAGVGSAGVAAAPDGVTSSTAAGGSPR